MKPPAQAVMDLLRSLDVAPGASINLYRVGPPLVAEGYSEDELARAIEGLIQDRVLEMVEGTSSVRIVGARE